jgi:hypothetical protein
MGVGRLVELLERARKKLLAHRARRIRPLRDDKILTAWNGFMIAALSKGFQALGDDRYTVAARKAADFILGAMRSGGGRLMRRFRQGEIAIPGFCDDYAFMIWGLIELYQSTFELKYLEEAISLSGEMLELFWDDERGGFFYVGKDGERLILRDKDIHDGAIPSANSAAALNLLRLARITGNPETGEKAKRLMDAFAGLVADYPSAYAQFLNALDFALGPNQEIVIAGIHGHENTHKMVRSAQKAFSPNRVLLARMEGKDDGELSGILPLTDALQPVDASPAAYICEDFSCGKAITDPEELESLLTVPA